MILSDPILKVKEIIQYGIHSQIIMGMNLFEVNNVSSSINLWKLFLEELFRALSCSIHVGTPLTQGNALEEFPSIRNKCIYSSIGLYGGMFYKSDTRFASCLLPNTHTIFDDIYMDELLEYDAVAIYVDPIQPYSVTVGNLKKILEHPPLIFTNYSDSNNEHLIANDINQKRWITCILKYFKILITTIGDKGQFILFTNNREDFNLILPLIAKIEETISLSPWYEKNKNVLKWDSEENLCLILPDLPDRTPF